MIYKMIDNLWLQVQKQGLAYSLIVLLAYVFWEENNDLKAKSEEQFVKMESEISSLKMQVEILTDRHINTLHNELKHSTIVIEKNNELLTKIDNKIRIMP